MNTKNGGARIDTAQMLASGTITGLHRKAKPVTLTVWQRAMRRTVGWLRALDAKLLKRRAGK